jgi:hypothetical protein
VLQYAPTSAPPAVVFAASPAATPAPASVASPVAAPSGPIATTADVSAGAFAGVSEAQHVEGLRKLYAVVAPEKLSQVRSPRAPAVACLLESEGRGLKRNVFVLIDGWGGMCEGCVTRELRGWCRMSLAGLGCVE